MANPLTKQIGPLPAGMWLVVIGGGLFVGYMVNKNMAKASTEEPSSQQLTETGVGTGGGQLVYDAPQSGSGDSTPDTNAAWGRRAVNYLVGTGVQATTAENAVNKYLQGHSLSIAEKALVNLASAAIGTPPESVPVPEEPSEDPDAGDPLPTAPAQLGVDRFTRRNVVHWVHDGKNVTRFVINARVVKTGNTTTAIVPAVWRANKYSWDHFAGGGNVSGLQIQYEIVPFNKEARGPSRSVTSTFIG